MQNYGQTSQAQFTVVTATTAEESLNIAMHGAAFVAVPANLVGCKDLSGAEMEPTVYAPAIELDTEDESDALPFELEEGETLLVNVQDEMIMFEGTDGLCEVVALTQDAAGDEWVNFVRTDGSYGFKHFDNFEDDIQAEILAAWDRQTVKGLRKLASV